MFLLEPVAWTWTTAASQYPCEWQGWINFGATGRLWITVHLCPEGR